ncbi:11278_t:CDS:2, partial [Racocetra persica]
YIKFSTPVAPQIRSCAIKKKYIEEFYYKNLYNQDFCQQNFGHKNFCKRFCTAPLAPSIKTETQN